MTNPAQPNSNLAQEAPQIDVPPGYMDIAPPSTSVPFPDPIAAPAEFLARLEHLGQGDLLEIWQHYESSPVPGTGNLYAEEAVTIWCDKMDGYLVTNLIFSFFYMVFYTKSNLPGSPQPHEAVKAGPFCLL
jgi:hypothetical protein